ncbi:hypothetical protein [Afipia broomeae]|uniref:Uncharacterized protein n=1 Tax=Afipia broomeae ATCC 49717 TaxID=883078 RepID=K8P4D4_9BRAD|nr:hypothetical protein [Afipia broomeae]EKS36341.1 hypothetical protein HMPREF9695_02759 [Afipia broomeae ATCC 49717]
MAEAGLLTRSRWRAALLAGTALAALAIPSTAQAVDGMDVLTGLASTYVSRLGVSQTF